MTPLRPVFPVLLSAVAVLATGGCRNDSTAAAEAPPPETQGLKGFFDPQPGESWTYAVTRDFAPGSTLRPSEEARATERPDGAQRITFERRRICAGAERPNGAEKELTAFTLYEDDHLVEREFYDITSAGLIGRGWAPASEITPAVTPPPKGLLLSPGVTIALPRMSGGQSWTAPGTKSGPLFHLDVIERATITVPAGEFETNRIRLTTKGPKRSTKRTVWFAENVGIVKEEIIHYGSERILVKEELVLTYWSHPTGDVPKPTSESESEPTPEPVSLATNGEPAPAPPGPPNPAPDTTTDDPDDDPATGSSDEPTAGDDPKVNNDPDDSDDKTDKPDDTGKSNGTDQAAGKDEGAPDKVADKPPVNKPPANKPPANKEPVPPKAEIVEE